MVLEKTSRVKLVKTTDNGFLHYIFDYEGPLDSKVVKDSLTIVNSKEPEIVNSLDNVSCEDPIFSVINKAPQFAGIKDISLKLSCDTFTIYTSSSGYLRIVGSKRDKVTLLHPVFLSAHTDSVDVSLQPVSNAIHETGIYRELGFGVFHQSLHSHSQGALQTTTVLEKYRDLSFPKNL